MIDTLLISTYELGHQPFGLASPAAWLEKAGATVRCNDLAVESLDENAAAQARLIAIYLPMHTATRLAIKLLPRLRRLNSQAHICCFGLYAPTNEDYLRQLGVGSIIGGEFEAELVALYKKLEASPAETEKAQKALISLDRQKFLVPDRRHLPPLNHYAHLILPDGQSRMAGYTESTRGCKHRCRHCPIVPIYDGRFRIVQREVVLADIRQQVAAGAEHITFGDPDFLNGPGHTMAIVMDLHEEYPQLTYDATIKVEHILANTQYLPVLRETGCVFITSAVEAVDDNVLAILEKGHTKAGFEQAAHMVKEAGIAFSPTFVAFTPWTTLESYLDMLRMIRNLDLINSVSPIQYAIRLLIPDGSRLLELEDVRALVQPFSHSALSYPWSHPDPLMDDLYVKVFRLVQQNRMNQEPRQNLFNNVWQAVLEMTGVSDPESPELTEWDLANKPVPRLSEAWY